MPGPGSGGCSRRSFVRGFLSRVPSAGWKFKAWRVVGAPGASALTCSTLVSLRLSRPLTQSRSSARPTKNAGCWSPMDDAFAAAIASSFGSRSRGVRRGAGVRGALGSRRGRGVGSRMTRDRSRRYSRLESVRKRPCVDAISLAACLVAFDVSPGRWFPLEQGPLLDEGKPRLALKHFQV